MVAWHARVFGDTRSRILDILRDAPRTAAALAEYLGLTNNAVRQHLAGLGAHGLVEQAGVQRDTGGKPAQLYALSSVGEELFRKGYATALVSVIDEVDSGGEAPTSARDLMHRAGVRLGAAVPIPPSADTAQRVRLAATALHSLGGDMEVDETDEGWRLRGRGCPLSAVVSERPVACELVRAFIAEVSGCAVGACESTGERASCNFVVLRSAVPAPAASLK